MNITIKKKALYFLETDRLKFRFWRRNDSALAIGLWGDPKVTRFFDRRPQLTKTQIKERLRQEIQNQEEYSVQYWPVFAKQKGQHVGAAGLRPKDIENKQYEIGFHICSRFWRKGYGSEAAAAVIQYAFTQLDASSLFAGHNPSNVASAQLLKRLGFAYTHDEYYEPTGLLHPSYLLKPSLSIKNNV
jgi:RimJ/RimL family protein N-acetyltransferase